jgi:hypothetical protein
MFHPPRHRKNAPIVAPARNAASGGRLNTTMSVSGARRMASTISDLRLVVLQVAVEDEEGVGRARHESFDAG